MPQLTDQQLAVLKQLLAELVNQEKAHILIAPNQPAPGFWFGGGNVVQDQNGVIWLAGRYRNYGDSRTGLQAGERGLECVIFRSEDEGHTFDKVHSWSKSDLSRPDRKVLSFEGTALYQRPDDLWELYVSSEKELAYPDPLTSFQKSGTGVWTIDRLTGPSPADLDPATSSPVLENFDRPEYLHVKDPVVFDFPQNEGAATGTALLFCSHPYTWSSSNTGLAIRSQPAADFELKTWEVVSRGATWDVAATRLTARLPLPAVGYFADQPAAALYFYDGAECLRQLEESDQAHKRPRGYSCEELGGALFGWDQAFPHMERLSPLAPLFMSPWGTGCSRYVDGLVTEAGILMIWQQSQADESQPLVSRFLPMSDVEAILSGG